MNEIHFVENGENWTKIAPARIMEFPENGNGQLPNRSKEKY